MGHRDVSAERGLHHRTLSPGARPFRFVPRIIAHYTSRLAAGGC